jgi:hypothetical protein
MSKMMCVTFLNVAIVLAIACLLVGDELKTLFMLAVTMLSLSLNGE